MWVIHYYAVIIFVVFLCSCTHRSLQHKNDTNQINALMDEKEILNIIHQEAMLIDVPIPIYDERIILPLTFQEPNSLVFGYKSPLSRVQARDFFMTQMERLGWQHLVSFESEDLLLQFFSPGRYCTVIIKNHQICISHTNIFIYIKTQFCDN